MQLVVLLLVTILVFTEGALRFKRQQTDDPWYYMNRGMLMMGKGMTEILTNKPYDQTNYYHSQVEEPHDVQNYAAQNDWYKNYYGTHGRRF